MELVIGNAKFDGSRNYQPFLLNWSRLEALPVTPDLEPGLQARIADPLWMLGRQWQFNEFQGEDAGTPIDVRLDVEQARLDRLRLGKAGQTPGEGVQDFQPLARPLEVVVEAEAEPRFNLRMSAEAGLQCLRRLRGAGLADAAKAISATYPLTLVGTNPSIDSTGAAWRDLMSRAMDGNALAAALMPFLAPDKSLNGLPPIAGIDATGPVTDSVKRILAIWLDEYRSSIDTGSSSRSAWIAERQEYVFAARAPLLDNSRVLLEVAEYADGELDWHSFVAAPDPGLGDPAAPVPAVSAKPSPKLPTPVRYPGMPADRYWEFEDSAVTFGRAAAGPTELMRSLLIDFALIYGNDWFYVPFDLPVGSLCSIRSLKVRDTFGVETSVKPTQGVGGKPWRLFELTRTGPAPARSWFFLAPALPARLQGDPIEELVLFRDEMANMAWGVERRVASPITGSIDRALEAYSSMLHQEVEGDGITAELVYRLQTDVPNRWIPLVPVTEPVPSTGTPAVSYRLERRALIRTLPDGSRQTIQPKGLLLRTDPRQKPETEPALRIVEEEIPREGAIVKRAYQYTRWLDGTSHLWLGREKTSGRGEGASDLRFDILVRRAPKG
jgi:hypothetical protein